MHLIVRNVEEAFTQMVEIAYSHVRWIPDSAVPNSTDIICTDSRNGKVYRWRRPVSITYYQPMERVLINPARDCNPFFHVFEAVWMLAGRRDVAPLLKYVARMKEYSDDGVTFHGAYGYRWRNWFAYDQLRSIIRELRLNPTSRRCVLQMWDGHTDFKKAIANGLDVPCNLSVTFNIVDGQLDMSVFNRSNDALWGALGANYVHMTFLQEYVAKNVGVGIGEYTQISSNMHFYESTWQPEKWLESVRHSNLYNPVEGVPCWCEWSPQTGHFDREANAFIDAYNSRCWDDPFLERVVKPMLIAYDAHKRKQYRVVSEALEMCIAQDWRMAASTWIERRRKD